jgi:hypothetical protein
LSRGIINGKENGKMRRKNEKGRKKKGKEEKERRKPKLT